MPDSPALSPDLIAALRCPETHQPLALAKADQLDRIRTTASAGDESTEQAPLDAALVTADGRLAYPVRDGFPILLLAAVIRLPATGDSTSSP